MAESNSQIWCRNYSKSLQASFESSALLEHKPTMGGSRESQILAVIQNLLPTRATLEKNVVITDATGELSSKFDGALIDRHIWPRIFAQDDLAVVMIESVITALEIKSNINSGEIDDIFSKTTSLREMSSQTRLPLCSAFAYQCDNIYLSFFDYAVNVERNGPLSPTAIAILNQAVFGLANQTSSGLVLADHPTRDSVAVLYRSGLDTLLFWIYFLSRWIAEGPHVPSYFRKYSDALFTQTGCFQFDRDFLNAVVNDSVLLGKARDKFKRACQKRSIVDYYQESRKEIGFK